MKVYITYKDSVQISPDDFSVTTKVIDVSELDTITEIYEKYFKKWHSDVNVELHIYPERW